MSEKNGGRILYFECNDGISGDMTLGALIDLGVSVLDIKRELDKFVPEPYDLVPHPFARNGINGTNLDVIIEGEGGSVMQGQLPSHAPKSYNFVSYDEPSHTHTHSRSFADIKKLIEKSSITGRSKGYAVSIFRVIAEGEAKVHGLPPEDVTFHEVGAMDSIIDIVGTAIAVDILGVEKIFTGVLHDGSGTILCQHGVIPVPVPAVMEMSQNAGYPMVIHEEVETEMITPTGFGIIKGLGAEFDPALSIIPEKVGYGFGKRDTGRLGAVRITLGTLY
ncbi:MAG: LarC family nickel insertion protein [Clostridiales Family XIII bacterium]|jgi:uncharacterized protein (DUF111 family)|nr:LarC family nickel insertion protein [Clostridiales Family XIII bacterium]